MINTNLPSTYPEISIPSMDVQGVRASYEQRRAQKPSEMTVLPYYAPADLSLDEETAIHVAKKGSDTEGNGTKEKPFASLARALEERADGGLVLLHGGTYQQKAPITVRYRGTKAKPLGIYGAKGERVIITTGRIIDGARLVRAMDAPFITESDIARMNRFTENNAKNVYVCDLSQFDFTEDDFAQMKKEPPCLFVDNDSYTLSRFPNIGEENEEMLIKNGLIRTTDSQEDIKRVGYVMDGISNLYYEHHNDVGGWEIYVDRVTYRDRLLAYAPKDEYLYLNGAVYEEWNRRTYHVTLEYDGERPYLKSETPAQYGAKHTGANTMYLSGMLEDLDAEGEFLVDATRRILYVYAENDLSKASLTLALNDFAPITVEDSSCVVISGIDFERSACKGIVLKDSEDLLVQDCRFKHLKDYGVTLNGCRRAAVTRSEFCQIYGVLIGGHPDLRTLSGMTTNIVQNNRYYRGKYATCCGVYGGGHGDVVSHNFFEEATMVIGGFETIVEFNEFHRGHQFVRDNGPIYMNYGSRNMHIRYNYLHDLNYSAYGIYLDDMTSGIFVYGNIVHYGKDALPHGMCANLHNGTMNVITNNLALHTTGAAIVNNLNYYPKTVNGEATGGGSLAYRWESIAKDRLKPRFHAYDQSAMAKYDPLYTWFTEIVDRSIEQMNANPNWKHSDKILPDEQDELMTRTPMMNIYENNVFYACERGLAIPEIGRETCAIKDNISYDEGTDLGFVCEDAGNYALKDDSIIYRDIPDFEKIPFEKMGLAL